MKKDYEKMWSELVQHIQYGQGDEARKIWDDIVEGDWKYQDLNK